MSLKAKIEAVIYASEEPVTLAQLAGLLGEEAQAELEALAAQQQSLALAQDAGTEPEGAEPDPDATGPGGGETGNTGGVVDAGDGPAQPEPEASAAVHAEGTTAAEQQSGREAAAQTRMRERKLREYFRYLLDQLTADYANGDRGLEIREVAGGFRMGTKAEYHDAVRGFVKSLKPPLKLTLQALETLAVVAYKQPITAPEVSEVRGVDSAGVLGSLLTRKLVTTAGRKQVIGRPILYKTTKDFLLRFGLRDINELPSIEEFEKMANELNEAVQEEIPMEDAGSIASDVQVEAGSHSAQADGTPDEDSEAPSRASEEA